MTPLAAMIIIPLAVSVGVLVGLIVCPFVLYYMVTRPGR